MLVIRPEQLRAIEDAQRGRFEEWLVAHVRRHFPDRALPMGDKALRALLQELVARAESFGFAEAHHLAEFVNLAMLLGAGFPEDPRMAWAGEILRDPERLPRQKLRAIRLGLDDPTLDALAAPASN